MGPFRVLKKIFCPIICVTQGTVTEVSGIDIANLDSETLCNLLLYGSPYMNMIDNRIIIEATIEYIEKTNRLN